MNIFNKISEIGNNFFNWIIEGIVPLPGIIKGLLVIVCFSLMAIGILTLLKKSFKIFGIILSVVFIIILVSFFLK